jgi:formylglycine-generating enzyme
MELNDMLKRNTNFSCCSIQRESNGNLIQQVSTIMNKDDHKKSMIYLPGGDFLMGTDTKKGFLTDGEGPVRNVNIMPFYIDPCAVTNWEFKEFVKSTGYQTEAEVFGWSFVFYQFVSKEVEQTVEGVVKGTPWWYVVKGAYWGSPEGEDSNIKDRMDHPVVHISWNDAMAYCNWTGKRLPTESEWEYAARGGLVQNEFPWGNELMSNGEHQCNIWQGLFPMSNTGQDGYLGTAPVKSFHPNNYGLYNTSGNVWEWCSEWFDQNSKVIRGGSYLCHESYCNRYRVAARSSSTPESSTGHMGFRCALDA